MLRTKLSLLSLFIVIAAFSGTIALTPAPARAETLPPCPNTYCNPTDTTCSYNWATTCLLDGTPPHFCNGWNLCG